MITVGKVMYLYRTCPMVLALIAPSFLLVARSGTTLILSGSSTILRLGVYLLKVEVVLAESGSARTDYQYLICCCLNYTIRQRPQHIEDHLQAIVTSINC